MTNLKDLKDYLLEAQLKCAQTKVTKDWSLKELEKALKSMKNGKARDELGHTYELFKYGGKSLKISLLKLLNAIKIGQKYPTFLEKSNITSIWKRKGEKRDIDNKRGIFNVTKVRSILEKMIYNDIYDNIDLNMSNSNIGARKNRNIRDHLFVINAIVNDVINNKDTEDVDLQIYDIAKCFDKLEFTNTATDLYTAGVRDDKFITITQSNKNCDIAIKTPWGKTPRFTLNNIEMQGTVLAGLKCSVSIDTIGKKALQNDHNILYKYRNCTSIPPLSMIDDIIGVSKCSPSSIELCGTIKGKISGKQLQLSERKCHHLHIGKHHAKCSVLILSDTKMQKSKSQRYLGDIISANGKNDENIADRFKRGIGLATQITGILKEISFGQFFFEQALQLRNAKLVNGLLCSIEAMYGLTNNNIETLEKCDRFLFSKIFNCPISTPIESFYLETATIPLRFVIIGRRLLFYWNILNKGKNELVKQVLLTQQISPVRNDWCSTVNEDLRSLNIHINQNNIAEMKKTTFKNAVSCQ